MSGILSIGPLMIAVDRALAVLAIVTFLGLGTMIGSRRDAAAGQASWVAVLIGVGAARIGFIVQNWSAFAVEPWTMLAFWQGGFAFWIGVAAALATLGWYLRARKITALLVSALIALAAGYAAITAALAPAPWPLTKGLIVARLDGEPLPLDRLHGRPFILNLWATWCPPCRRETPMIIDVAGKSGIPVLLINQGETGAQVKQFLARDRLPRSAVFLDPAQRLSAAIGAQAFPTTLFVDASGTVVAVHVGEISRAALVAGARSLERRKR